MTAETYTLGPGSLIVGETASELEISCQITSASVNPDVDTEDDTPLLCGNVKPGRETFTATISGTMFQDISEDGIIDYSWEHKGEVLPVEFIPSTAAGRRVVGQVKMRPLGLGGDADTEPDIDFEWPFLEFPDLETVSGGGD